MRGNTMLRSIKDINSYPIEAIDGPIGKAKDCLFDDQKWILRHIVVDTGNWLPGKKVLINSSHMQKPEVGYSRHKIPVIVTKKQIEDCPELKSDAPVSRQYETELAEYYKIQPYWLITDLFENSQENASKPEADPSLSPEEKRELEDLREQIESSHLRSAKEVFGYQINASDGEFGYVEDLIMEDDTWTILFFVVSTRKWLPGRKFLVDVNWIKTFDWEKNQASVGLNRERIESSPEYDPEKPVNMDYLENLYDFYGMPKRKEEVPIMVPPM
jgi:hypothetical protein